MSRGRSMSKEKVLCKVFDILEVGIPNMSEFSNRLKYQKIVYLLQSFGLSLDYDFSWYLKGPYSSRLAHVLYYIESHPLIYQDSKQLTFKDNDVIVEELNKFKKTLGSSINDVLYLEVLASLYYINMARFSGNGTITQLKDSLFDIKPDLRNRTKNNEIIQKAYQDLNNFTY